MGTILGIDVGTKRVGLAIHNGDNAPAAPLKTVNRAANQAESEIVNLIREKEISTVVVGMPYGENREETEQCEDVRRFCRRLEKRIGIPILFVDEYSSSFEAEERLKMAGHSAKEMKARGLIDAASAAVILEDYLRMNGSTDKGGK